jgi:hypothetical protein
MWRLLKKLDIDLPFDPAIPLLGIYAKDCDTGYSRGTCTPMFIAALFTIAKLWKQPRCPTTEGVGHGGEMTQALYAHMNNKKIKIKKNIWAN